jgi:hypothetical protein
MSLIFCGELLPSSIYEDLLCLKPSLPASQATMILHAAFKNIPNALALRRRWSRIRSLLNMFGYLMLVRGHWGIRSVGYTQAIVGVVILNLFPMRQHTLKCLNLSKVTLTFGRVWTRRCPLTSLGFLE